MHHFRFRHCHRHFDDVDDAVAVVVDVDGWELDPGKDERRMMVVVAAVVVFVKGIQLNLRDCSTAQLVEVESVVDDDDVTEPSEFH